ncbi:hypothetical protein MO867_19900 [Microbulbifer sp. OS29]|uniref:Uncharacterized protein n=1 Tax=Microbulbifer okhotskensis TaxID=2926617 RepID=A0A9X2J6G2_9GAMM|nr:hypothetical protein [Microbulbifer okhotskensis]MCO1336597.1 hypothetical protein [Microbulbifer okhotskensis]
MVSYADPVHRRLLAEIRLLEDIGLAQSLHEYPFDQECPLQEAFGSISEACKGMHGLIVARVAQELLASTLVGLPLGPTRFQEISGIWIIAEAEFGGRG